MNPVGSLAELFQLAKTDPRYATLLRDASMNLGGPRADAPIDDHRRWLTTTALETDEPGVVAEVNFLLD